MEILILGVGNILLMDEGAGIRAVEELQRRYRFPENVELLDGGTAGIELLRYLRNKGLVIIIDTMKNDQVPGTIMKVVGKDVPAMLQTRISPHQLGLSDLLAAAQLTNELPANVVLFGVEPKTVATGLTLSDELASSFDDLLEAVINELQNFGCDVQPKTYEHQRENSFWRNAG